MTTIFTRAEREPHCSAARSSKGDQGQGEVGSQLWVAWLGSGVCASRGTRGTRAWTDRPMAESKSMVVMETGNSSQIPTPSHGRTVRSTRRRALNGTTAPPSWTSIGGCIRQNG